MTVQSKVILSGRWGKTSVHTLSSLFLKILREGAVATEPGSVLLYFTTLTEKADPTIEMLFLWSRGALLGRVERERENKEAQIHI